LFDPTVWDGSVSSRMIAPVRHVPLGGEVQEIGNHERVKKYSIDPRATEREAAVMRESSRPRQTLQARQGHHVAISGHSRRLAAEREQSAISAEMSSIKRIAPLARTHASATNLIGYAHLRTVRNLPHCNIDAVS